MKHVHYDAMMRVMSDTDGWGWRWRHTSEKGGYSNWRELAAETCACLPDHDYEFRRKTGTGMRRLTGTYPEPMREAPKHGTVVWTARYTAELYAFYWGNDDLDKSRLAAGLCHATESAAQQQADALQQSEPCEGWETISSPGRVG